MDEPEREMPGKSARACAPPTLTASTNGSASRLRVADVARRRRRSPKNMMPALTMRNTDTISVEPNSCRTGFSRKTPSNSDRDRPEDEQPGGPPVAPVADAAARDRSGERPHDPHPVLAIERDECDRGPQVQCDDEREERRVGPVDRPVEQGRHEDRMAEAADREQFAEALQHREQHGLEKRHGSVAGALRIGRLASCPRSRRGKYSLRRPWRSCRSPASTNSPWPPGRRRCRAAPNPTTCRSSRRGRSPRRSGRP